MLTQHEHRHITQHYPAIDPHKVGKHLGTGIEKVAYVTDQVIAYAANAMEGTRRGVLKLLRKDARRDPMSMFVSPLFTATYDQAREDADTCLEYFGDAVVVPKIIRSTRDKASYCMLQQKLEMEMLTPELCVRFPHLLQELKHMIEQDKKLQMDKRRFFDFQGWDIWRVLCDQVAMGNVAVVWEQSETGVSLPGLKIFDLTLMHTPEFSLSGIAHAGGYYSNQRNNHRMVQRAEFDLTA